jgi:hypothetical protein
MKRRWCNASGRGTEPHHSPVGERGQHGDGEFDDRQDREERVRRARHGHRNEARNAAREERREQELEQTALLFDVLDARENSYAVAPEESPVETIFAVHGRVHRDGAGNRRRPEHEVEQANEEDGPAEQAEKDLKRPAHFEAPPFERLDRTL